MSITIQEIHGTHVSRVNSEKDRLISDYLTVAMSEADSVDIMVGYFRIGFFHHFALLFVLLFRLEKKVRIICGHQLGPQEEKLIFDHDSPLPNDVEVDALLNRIWESALNESSNNEQINDVFILVKHLLQSGLLSIKPVLVLDDRTGSIGLFHHKEYFFHTASGISYATGSFNMTARAVDINSENLKVDFVQTADGARYDDVIRRFEVMEDIWQDSYPGYVKASKSDIVVDSFESNIDSANSIEIDQTALRVVNGFRDEISEEVKQFLEDSFLGSEVFSNKIKLRPHQKEAIMMWREAEYSGLLEMATGAGKTITAIQGVSELESALGHELPVIILVPSKALIDQWYEEVSKFLPNRILVCTSGKRVDREWRTVLRIRLAMFSAGNFQASPILIGVYGTVLKQLKSWKVENHKLVEALEHSLLIADECHSIGAPQCKKSFVDTLFRYRIGLSATPDRYMDDEGTAFVRRTFNALPESTFVYSLSDAIADGFLVPYEYEPVTFILDSETQEAYSEISQRIKRLMHADEESPAGKLLQNLLIARVRLVMKSPAKKAAFERWLKERIEKKDPRIHAMIIYAPEGFGVEDEDRRVIDDYQSILYENKLKTATFLGGSNEDHEMDSPLLVFQRGGLDALIAMKCLDEGVDLPRAECGVFLSSTGNTRQYIQRRGRLIRLFETNHMKKTSASVVDFICLPVTDDFGSTPDMVSVEESILRRELFRAAQFAKDALNQADAEDKISMKMDQMNYAHLWKERLLE